MLLLAPTLITDMIVDLSPLLRLKENPFTKALPRWTEIEEDAATLNVTSKPEVPQYWTLLLH